MPLEQVVDELSRQTGQPIKVEWEAPHLDWRVSRQSDVTIDLDDITLYSAIQTIFAKVAPGMPVHYGVRRGVVTVSSREQQWDVVARTYDLSDLVGSSSEHLGTGPPLLVSLSPMSVSSGTPVEPSRVGNLVVRLLFKPGRIGPSSSKPTPREKAMDELTSLICSILVNNPLNGTTSPVVNQWGERLVVVAAEPQQRILERFVVTLRAKIAARTSPTTTPTGAAQSLGFDGTAIAPMNPPDDPNSVLDCVISKVEISRTSLRAALEKLQDQTGFILATWSPREVPMHDLVEAHLAKVTLRNALNAVLRQVKPTPAFFAEGRIVVIGDEKKETRLYDVRTLLSQDPTASGQRKRARRNALLLELADIIEGPIAWYQDPEIRTFRISVMEWDGILVVHETPRIHRELSQLFQE